MRPSSGRTEERDIPTGQAGDVSIGDLQSLVAYRHLLGNQRDYDHLIEMTDTNPARALNVVQRVVMMCDFFDHTAIKTAVEQAVPVTMPRAPGALGFDIPLWVGLGMVGLWAALDGFADRAGLKKPTCTTCRMRCIPTRFASYTQGNEGQSLKELEDLRHLYAHNYAGEADDEYFKIRTRHVLQRGVTTQLTCGAAFDGRRPWLDLPHLRMYSCTVQSVLERFP